MAVPTILRGQNTSIKYTICCWTHKKYFSYGNTTHWNATEHTKEKQKIMYLFRSRPRTNERGIMINMMKTIVAWSSARNERSSEYIYFTSLNYLQLSWNPRFIQPQKYLPIIQLIPMSHLFNPSTVRILQI